MAYEWCSVVCKNRQSCEDWESLVFGSLEIGFRHLDPLCPWAPAKLTNTEHHRELLDIVFKSEESEVIADLLQAWTMGDIIGVHQAPALLGMCTGYLVSLHSLLLFSPRLRRLVIRSVELIGYKRFVEGGAERFIELLNHLHVGVEDIDYPPTWVPMLLGAIETPEGTQSLSVQSWELLAELTTSYGWWSEPPAYNQQVMASLLGAQEWEKLECWMGLSGCYGHPRLMRRQRTSRTRRYRCSASGLVLCKDSHNGWSNGTTESARRCLRHSTESADSRTKQHNLVYREFPFVLTGYALGLTRGSISLQVESIA
jgi:hypothetical protein